MSISQHFKAFGLNEFKKELNTSKNDERTLKTREMTLRKISVGKMAKPFRIGDHSIDFYEERERLLRDGRLFEDPDLPAATTSIYAKDVSKLNRPLRHFVKNIVWKRPGEIVDNPQLFVNGATRFDVVQGLVGDCWFVSAISALALRDELFFRVVPPDQGFGENYAGIFHFQFWHFGEWVDVVVDDRLPLYKNKLVFVHSEEKNEFWSALVEKAYAKLNGSYWALKDGVTTEALEDFTGGVTIRQEDDDKDELFLSICKALNNNELVTAKVPATFKQRMNRTLLDSCLKHFKKTVNHSWSKHLLKSFNERKKSHLKSFIGMHTYSVTGVSFIQKGEDGEALIRVRNPWGEHIDRRRKLAPKWEKISNEEKLAAGIVKGEDGEHWLPLEEFVKHFHHVEICHLPNSEHWKMRQLSGHWDGQGGGPDFIGLIMRNMLGKGSGHLAKNQQFLIVVKGAESPFGHKLIVSALQKSLDKGKHRATHATLVHLFETEDPLARLTADDLKDKKSIVHPPLSQRRSNVLTTQVQPGCYILIVSTLRPGVEGDFLLRVYSSTSIELWGDNKWPPILSTKEESASTKDSSSICFY